MTILSLFVSCGVQQTKLIGSDDSYFEGIILFNITYEMKRPVASPEELEDILGKTMKYTFKEGNYLQEYFDTKEKLIQRRWFNMDTHLSYLEFIDSDTIYYYDPIETDHKLDMLEVLENEEILTHSCKVIQTILSPKAGFEELGSSNTTYSISEDLKIDPTWYANLNDGAYNKIAAIGKGCFLRILKNGPAFDTNLLANRILRKKIDSAEFKIESKKTMLKI